VHTGGSGRHASGAAPPGVRPAGPPVNTSHYVAAAAAAATPAVHSAAPAVSRHHRDRPHGDGFGSLAAVPAYSQRAATSKQPSDSSAVREASASSSVVKDSRTGWMTYEARPLHNKRSGPTQGSSSSGSSSMQTAASTSRLSLTHQQQQHRSGSSVLLREGLLQLRLLHQSGDCVNVQAKVHTSTCNTCYITRSACLFTSLWL
jgi:hypothetical protein